MTLAELEALSDEELIELCATEVMGWEKQLRVYTTCEHCGERTSESHVWWSLDNQPELYPIWCDKWNPLTDWNHTMEVVKQMNSKDFAFHVEQGTLAGIDRPESGRIGETWVKFINIYAAKAGESCEKDFQRAIVLAALLTT